MCISRYVAFLLGVYLASIGHRAVAQESSSEQLAFILAGDKGQIDAGLVAAANKLKYDQSRAIDEKERIAAAFALTYTHYIGSGDSIHRDITSAEFMAAIPKFWENNKRRVVADICSSITKKNLSKRVKVSYCVLLGALCQNAKDRNSFDTSEIARSIGEMFRDGYPQLATNETLPTYDYVTISLKGSGPTYIDYTAARGILLRLADDAVNSETPNKSLLDEVIKSLSVNSVESDEELAELKRIQNDLATDAGQKEGGFVIGESKSSDSSLRKIGYLSLLLFSIVASAFLASAYFFKPELLIDIYEASVNGLNGGSVRLFGLELKLARISPLERFFLSEKSIDAWIMRRSEKIRQNFSSMDLVKERSIYVPTPVNFEGSDSSLLTFSPEFRSWCKSSDACIFIHGAGGSGKTSLACKLCLDSISKTSDAWPLRSHPCIPVFFDSDICSVSQNASVGEKFNFAELVRHQLHQILRQQFAPSDGFVDRLLVTGRVLVVLDGFSELPLSFRNSIGLNSQKIIASNVLITSRYRLNLGSTPNRKLEVLPLKGFDQINEFVAEYHRVGNPESKIDPSNVAQQITERFQANVPVFLARLLVDIHQSQESSGASEEHFELPRSVFELILFYLTRLNSQVQESMHPELVRDFGLVLGFETVKKSWRADWASESEFLDSSLWCSSALEAESELSGSREARHGLLIYVEERLRMVRRWLYRPEGASLRFSLDPLAEYLAALLIVRFNGSSQDKWAYFANSAFEESEISSESSKEHVDACKKFLDLIEECLKTKLKENNVGLKYIALMKNALADGRVPRYLMLLN